MEEREKERKEEELKTQPDSTGLPVDSTNRDTSTNTIEPNKSAIKNEEEEGGNNEN